MGNNTAIAIDLFTGLLSVNSSQAFDYERQSLLYFQVLARDSLITELNETLHYSYAQLLIRVEDVNDETPVIKTVRDCRGMSLKYLYILIQITYKNKSVRANFYP